jgi:hypothetical protein
MDSTTVSAVQTVSGSVVVIISALVTLISTVAGYKYGKTQERKEHVYNREIHEFYQTESAE